MLRLLDFGVVSLQAAIGGATLEAVRRDNWAAAVNGVASLAAALLPAVAFGDVVGLGSPLSLWVAAAGFLHCLGMLGFYESVWWWDHLTHVVSAALVAAICYAALLAASVVDAAVGAVLLTLGVGLAWELVELVARDVGERFDVEPVLVHYGWRDTALDLVFDAVGAALIVALDVRLLVPVVGAVPDAIVRWSAGLVVAGTLLLGLLLLGLGG